MAVDLGDLNRLQWTNLSPAGAPVNATTVTLTITLPDLTTVVVTPVTPVSTGVYQHDYLTTMEGRHLARWVGTGTNPGAYVETFDVASATPPYISSLSTVKRQLGITGTTHDEDLRDVLGAATRVIEDHTRQAVVQRTEIEDIEANGTRVIMLGKHPVISLTSLVTADGSYTWDITGIRVGKPTGRLKVITGPLFSGDLVATYVAGMVTVPENFIGAAKHIVQHLWEIRRGTAGGPRPGGMDSGEFFSSVSAFAIPKAALELLGPSPSMMR